jgi:hypothetical protein
MTMELTRLFTIPITKIWVAETAALKQQLLPEMLRRYEAGEQGGSDLLEPLPEAYRRLLRSVLDTDAIRFSARHSVFWKGHEYESQQHEIPWHFTVIHFLAFDRAEHAPPVFYDPARAIKAYCRHDAVPHEFWSEGEAMEVFEGDALIFPSYLEHRVAPGQYAKPRVTVSVTLALTEAG